jgi:asparagine synthase (glutamine-hydrolysing)
MCGIAGLFNRYRQTTPDDVDAVRRMLTAQIHRGPDGEGLHRDACVVLGHRRLAIIDLSAAAGQPMANADGTVWLSYNGEIYNYRELRTEIMARGYRFISQSDTEVILHGYEAWGLDGLLSRLRDMFAFALYDARPNPTGAHASAPRLLLVRDRLGIKPLYYTVATGAAEIAFASSVKALLAGGMVASNLDREALAGFLHFGSVPSPLTTVKGIRCLLPGHYLAVTRDGVAVQRYWDLPTPPDDEPGGEAVSFTADLRTTLADTVRRHLISDVPVGLFLSGGVDSMALAVLASQAEPAPLRTLTVAFDEKDFSEAEPARQMAEQHGTDHREVLVTSADFIRELPHIFAAMDQPTHDGVNTYFVAKAARESGLTVVLSGLGGDEVFWGYRHYRWLARYQRPLHWWGRLPRALRQALVSAASAYGRLRGQERVMRLSALGTQTSAEACYSVIRGFFAPPQVAKLMGLGKTETRMSLAQSYASLCPGTAHGVPSVRAFNALEMKRYLHDQLLRDADTFSMAHSLELRVPYLDHPLVESVAALPPRFKCDHGLNKPLLVHALGDASLLAAGKRKKRGFSLPMDHWMKQHVGSLEAIALGTNDLDRHIVRRLWAAFRTGRLHWSRAWALVVLGAVGSLDTPPSLSGRLARARAL